MVFSPRRGELSVLRDATAAIIGDVVALALEVVLQIAWLTALG